MNTTFFICASLMTYQRAIYYMASWGAGKRRSSGSPQFDLDVLHYLPHGGESGHMVLRPVAERNHWRVEMAWPGHKRHYFGHFHSRTEAEKWIEEHRWLAEQTQEPDEKPSHIP